MDEQTVKGRFASLPELQRRIITAVALSLTAILIIWAGGFLFQACIIFAAIAMYQEWERLTADFGRRWQMAGYAYVIIPCTCLILLRQMGFVQEVSSGDETQHIMWVSPFLVAFPILCVAATDIGAYVAGKLIGGPKLAPSISPGKTWAGLFGGIAAASVLGAFIAPFSPYPQFIGTGFIVGLVLACLSQLGDLFESWLKRRAGVKDSGVIFPGHGGILDRVDGHVIAIPVFTVLAWLAGGTIL